MQGRSCHLPLCGVVMLLAGLAAMPATPAFGKLPRTYQVTRVDSPEPQANGRFGDNIINAGDDFDGDTKDDLLVGIDRRGLIKGKLFLLDGITGSLIYSVPAPSDDVDNDGTEQQSPSDDPAGFGAAIAIGDIGQCPGGSPGADCAAQQSQQDTPDLHPDFVVSAPGLDLATEGDDLGAVFVIDGRSGAILKRLKAPDSNATGFGRSVLVPMGEPPCGGVGKGGVGAKCDYSPGGSPAVVSGDLDDRGKPDIVIGSPDYNETSASNPACSDGGGGGSCSRAGRAYIYFGEDLAGTGPSVFQSPTQSADVTGVQTLKNPYAQHDVSNSDSRYWAESMGASLAPVGDIGTCNESVSYGASCAADARVNLPDGQPEFVVSVPGADIGAVLDAGRAFAVDGRTGRILDTYADPEPETGGLFGFSNSNRPALGDAGGADTLPDVYLPAIGHSFQELGQGRGFVFSGRTTVDPSSHLFSILDDPTPAKFGNFGTSSAGLGNVAGAEAGLDNARKEILIGSYAPQDSNPGSEKLINDVHIFSPLKDQVLQTIPDPDQQAGSGFGRGLAPLGDLNDDGMVDFAVGAGGYDSSSPTAIDRGRIYLFMSDDSRPPVAPAPPRTTPSGGGSTTTTQPLAGRAIELEANKTRIFAGRRILLRGAVEAFARKQRCEQNQLVEIQRRRRGKIRYATFGRVRTNRAGSFSLRIRPRITYFYRARVRQNAFCVGAVSPREKVVVRKKPRSARR